MAPVAPWQVLTSKLLVSLVIGLASMVTLALFSTWLLGAQLGQPARGGDADPQRVCWPRWPRSASWWGVAKTPEQAGAMQAVVALVLGVLGGAFFSMARAGGVAAVASRLTPHYWFNEGLVRLTGGRDWTSALAPAGALLLFTVVVGVPGLILARRTMRP